MDAPLISIIIPLYNHEKFIREAVLSVLNQQVEDFELIIIDDGSNDESADIVTAIPDRRIKFFSQSNQGAHRTINRGIKLAGGKYIAILNSDDIYHPDRLSRCLNYLEQNQQIAAVFTQVEAIDETGEHLYYFQTTPPYENKGFRSHPDQLIALDLLGKNLTTSTSNIFCRRQVFDEVGLFRKFRYCHDLDFLLRLVYHKHVRWIREPLLKYRFHHANTIMEDSALVCFEVALILMDFINAGRLATTFPASTDMSEKMAALCHSLHFRCLDRTLAVLAALIQTEKNWPFVLEKLLSDPADPFRRACLEDIKKGLPEDLGQQTRQEDNLHLRRIVEKLQQENECIRRSFSWRLARMLSAPGRKLLRLFGTSLP